MIQNSKKNWIVVSKMTRIWWILTWALEILKISALIGSFCPKYINVWSKNIQKSCDTEEWCKIWKKIDLWFGKWHEELGLWWDAFIQSRKCMSLKFTEELCVIAMKNDAKFEKVLTCRFKIDMRNLTNFNLNTSKVSKICTLMGSFWTKYIMFELKKYRGVMFDGTEYWCKTWRKTDLCFQKWHEEFGKFSQAEK